jgi:hypothetical protein
MKFDIVPGMKKTLLLAVLLLSAVPGFAQSSEFGIIVGGSRRGVDHPPSREGLPPEEAFIDDEFTISNSAVDLYYGFAIEPQTWIKIRAGRIETPVRYVESVTRDADGEITQRFGADVEGEAQYANIVAEYRFNEAFGRTGLFGGVGFYRHSGDGIDSSSNYGWLAGVNADFPMTRRYGLMLEATHHWTRAEFKPKYLTFGAGLRVSF